MDQEPLLTEKLDYSGPQRIAAGHVPEQGQQIFFGHIRRQLAGMGAGDFADLCFHTSGLTLIDEWWRLLRLPFSLWWLATPLIGPLGLRLAEP